MGSSAVRVARNAAEREARKSAHLYQITVWIDPEERIETIYGRVPGAAWVAAEAVRIEGASVRAMQDGATKLLAVFGKPPTYNRMRDTDRRALNAVAVRRLMESTRAVAK